MLTVPESADSGQRVQHRGKLHTQRVHGREKAEEKHAKMAQPGETTTLPMESMEASYEELYNRTALRAEDGT